MVFLSPFRKMKTGIDASNKPVMQGMIDRKGSGGKAKRVLVVYHLDSEGFTPVMYIFPSFDFVEASQDLGCQSHRSMWTKWVKPGKSTMVQVLASECLAFTLNLFSDD